MKKNILVLTGSARKGGNSDALADAFVTGALLSGNSVEKYTTADKNLKGCIDCKTCFSKGRACTLDEEFSALAEKIEHADALVLATPLYWFSFPAQMKTAIDKIFSFLIGQKELKIKESILLATCGDENAESFAGLTASYHLIVNHMGWEDKGSVLVPGLLQKDDILQTDALQKAKKLGQSI